MVCECLRQDEIGRIEFRLDAGVPDVERGIDEQTTSFEGGFHRGEERLGKELEDHYQVIERDRENEAVQVCDDARHIERSDPSLCTQPRDCDQTDVHGINLETAFRKEQRVTSYAARDIERAACPQLIHMGSEKRIGLRPSVALPPVPAIPFISISVHHYVEDSRLTVRGRSLWKKKDSEPPRHKDTKGNRPIASAKILVRILRKTRFLKKAGFPDLSGKNF
jgi:hypothetical protein